MSYLAVIGALLAMRSTSGPGGGVATPGGVLAGLRYARSRQQLWLPLAMMALVGLLAFNFSVILPVLAQIGWDREPHPAPRSETLCRVLRSG